MSDNLVTTCRAADIFDDPDCEALLAEHESECANALLGPTRPQRWLYGAMEVSGSGQCFAAYRGGELVGYAFVMVGPLPHYEGRFATVDGPFVTVTARSTGLGDTLMEAVEDHGKRAGCEAVFYSTPTYSRLGRLLTLRPEEYCLTNRIFTRKLR
jgi:GNAT superfamily N-acetyltransferase